MINKFVQALADGKIMAVSWRNIQESLGENGEQQQKCSICSNEDVFPPKPLETYHLSETEVSQILNQASIGWMAETYEGEPLVSPIKARYFISIEPKAGTWLKGPN